MKNAVPAELAALRARAAQIARRSEPLEAAVRRVMQQNRTIGLSLVLCHPDGRNTFLHEGYARLSPRTPVSGNTCFRVASISKLAMSFVILHLCEIGWLNLDEDVSETLEFPVRSPHFPDVPITLRMLLTHTSGIRDEGNYGTLGMQPGTTLDVLLADPQNWTDKRPGEAFHYTNLGAGAAGVVAECAADTRFDFLLQNLLSIPLDVRMSYNPGAIDPTDDLADGYSVRGVLPPRLRYGAARIAKAAQENRRPFNPLEDYLVTAGRLITDSKGMAALIRLLASDGEIDGQRILQKASLDEIRALQDGRPGVAHAGRGLNTAFLPGVFPGHDVLGHQGVAYGMCAELFADPQNNCGVGVMTSGTRLVKTAPLMRAGFDLLALGFAALDSYTP